VDLANGAKLIARSTAIGTAEKFTVVSQSNGTVALLALANNQYVSADLNYSAVLYANRAAASTWEQFTISGGGGGGGGSSDLGPNVIVFDPSMSQTDIQNKVNSVYSAQQNNQFGTARYALLFKPGTYAVDVNVGFYTQVLGLGALPDQVSITQEVHSEPVLADNNATQNFWRGLENFSTVRSFVRSRDTGGATNRVDGRIRARFEAVG
jgi:hypothetical protein